MSGCTRPPFLPASRQPAAPVRVTPARCCRPRHASLPFPSASRRAVRVMPARRSRPRRSGPLLPLASAPALSGPGGVSGDPLSGPAFVPACPYRHPTFHDLRQLHLCKGSGIGAFTAPWPYPPSLERAGQPGNLRVSSYNGHGARPYHGRLEPSGRKGAGNRRPSFRENPFLPHCPGHLAFT